MNGRNICPRCFANGYSVYCGMCGYQRQADDPNVLRPFTLLKDRYLLGIPIGIGGFGITYAAKDIKTGSRLAVKEYFPQGIALRDTACTVRGAEGYRQAFRHGLGRFSMEARALQALADVPGIVHVDDIFEWNGTGYIVMEHLPGRTLNKDAEMMGDIYPFSRASAVLWQTASALARVHEAGLLHRDISPDNIMVDDAASAKLIDFGAARAYMQQELTVMVKRGYAPIEQYSSTASQGCYTDVYALGCTMYAILTGRRVPEAPARLDGAVTPALSHLRPDLPAHFAAAIEKAIEILPQNRFQTMREFLLASEGAEAKKHVFAQNAVLRVIGGKCSGMTFSLERERIYLIGRSAGDYRIQIPVESLSKAHFGVRYQPMRGRFIVWDDHSTNGSFFRSGARLTPGCKYASLPGDIFYLAKKGCVVQLDVR